MGGGLLTRPCNTVVGPTLFRYQQAWTPPHQWADGRGGNVKAETLQVPDASLYYEVRGSGPVLLMIPGGPMDADGFKEIAHEPPVSELLPDAARYHALNEQVGVTYRSDGTFAALQMFTKGVGFGNDGPPPPAEQTPEAAAAGARMGVVHAGADGVPDRARTGRTARQPASAVPWRPRRLRQPSRRVRGQAPRGAGGGRRLAPP
jgi:hypothetical protein